MNLGNEQIYTVKQLLIYIKDNYVLICVYAVFGVILYSGFMNLIQSIECPEMTQMEIFLRSPKSFLGEIKKCY
jgi:hypothetical protein